MSELDKNALLPCPFCGSDDTIPFVRSDGGLTILCANCDAEGPMVDDHKQAIESWNTRAAPQAPPDVVEVVAGHLEREATAWDSLHIDIAHDFREAARLLRTPYVKQSLQAVGFVIRKDGK